MKKRWQRSLLWNKHRQDTKKNQSLIDIDSDDSETNDEKQKPAKKAKSTGSANEKPSKSLEFAEMDSEDSEVIDIIGGGHGYLHKKYSAHPMLKRLT